MLAKVVQRAKEFKQARDKKKKQDFIFDVPIPDFIPYACHFDPDTILTKNGELIQTIKITGFSGEVVGSKHPELRESIRKSVAQHIKTNDFALWFHTIRSQRNLDPGGHYANDFSYSLNQAWKKRHEWNKKYVNEVYVTIIRSGVSAKLTDQVDRALTFASLKKYHMVSLDRAAKELKKVVDGMLETLTAFGACRLTMYENDNAMHSQLLEFFGKILYLTEETMKAPVSDLSDYLARHKIAFGFDTLEVHGKTGKRFGAIFTIKEYHDVPTKVLDRILQLPQEFIVTQTVDFIGSQAALSFFKAQYEVYEISGSSEFAALNGLESVVKSDQGNETDFGESQLTILLLSETTELLSEQVITLTDAFADVGLLVTRRDLRMEECFWAQLPANFEFISRRKPVATRHIGGLASLYNFPAGKKKGNRWGPAVTAFYTAKGTPYFFNFHVKESGHTTILGPNGAGKTVLMNFLISEAQKYNGKLFFFDQDRASKVFIRSINGYYTIIEPERASSEYAFNPFNIINIIDNEMNRSFLKYWLLLLASAGGYNVTKEDRILLASSVEYIASQPEDQRILRNAIAHINDKMSPQLKEHMALWHSDGKYAHLFDNDRKDIVPLDGRIYGFGMSFVLEDKLSHGPILSYLLHRVEMALDGTPTVIVLDEAWKLVNNPIFAPKISNWLDRMTKKNAMVVFATQSVENASKSEVTQSITSKISTQIFLPNSRADESSIAYRNVWGLSEKEFEMLSNMSLRRREFMLRQEGNAVVSTLDLGGMPEVFVLSGGDIAVRLMEESINESTPAPKDWLPIFYKKCDEV